MTTRLLDGFMGASERFATRPALEVGGITLSYRELHGRATTLAATLSRTPPGGPPLTAVFAHRSVTGFAGILGALCAGHGYVPLNRTYPVARSRWMLSSSDCRALIVDASSEAQLDALLEGIEWPLLIVLPDRADVSDVAARWPRHTVVGAEGLEPATSWRTPSVGPESIAYLLFTSGSTGHPKGVMVSHRNVGHFVEVMRAGYGTTESDRFSQMFDTTFDLSVLDMFVAWTSGACVCCPSDKTLLNPGRFINDSRVTVWGSVPSVGVLMKRFGALKAGRYPALRWSLFCGEPLPVEVAEAWSKAAPNSVVENLYGPTELTVACSSYRWDSERSPGECELGTVPIGQPFPGMHALVVDETSREVAPGAVGELLMCGPQVTPGYWKNPDATQRAYTTPEGQTATFYRTGDRVRRPAGAGPMTYIGRVDHQVKILGHRVELGEVESRLRAESGVDEAVALGWPLTTTGAAGVAAFVTGTTIDTATLRTNVAAGLPGYAVPHTVTVLPELPHTANGKIDRQALLERLQA